jgi:uncharacterized membrane protein
MDHKPSAAQPLPEMSSARLEGFSDGVLAVIITIMVLGLVPPKHADLSDLKQMITPLLIYVLSFAFIAMYWNNHHHLLRATRRISSGVMWANLHLLFWLSLVPVVTAWVGAHGLFSRGPAITYGVVGFLAGVAYYILTLTIRKANKDTPIDELLGKDIKGKVSVLIYSVGIALAFILPPLAYVAYAVVSIMWFIPDRRLAQSDGKQT